MRKIKVLSVFGTRPEGIKMCPLILELQNHENFESIVCVTGQHREMLDQVLDIFGIKPHYDLNIMKDRQTLTNISVSILKELEKILEEVSPDIVLVHGDTSTSFVAALASFYKKIPVGHVEAGLRTYDKYSPFPEEMNRQLVSRIAEYHFIPTENNKKNLENEKVQGKFFVTGNTVIDAFKTTVKKSYKFKCIELNKLDFSKKIILLTAHRRENLGKPLEQICEAVREIAKDYSDVEIVYPVHLNPMVKNIAYHYLKYIERIHLVDPLDVEDMHNLISKCYLVMTDSGGLQEEAPHLGKPVIVLRTETERPEAVEAGTVKVVGVKKKDIVENVIRLLNSKTEYLNMARATNPYGDGNASSRIVSAIAEMMG